jgi:prepilin-type N-terminal cleavage/methylation domain-containing protein
MATLSEKTMDVRGARAGRRRGFTLIELLIVIGIIGILISLLFPAVRGVIESARRQQTRQACKAIETAIKAYYNDYGRYPLQGTLSTAQNSQPQTYTTNYSQLIEILRGLNTSIATTHNPRAIAYLDVPQGSLNTSGLFVDPWDQTFGVRADWGNANSLTLFGQAWSGVTVMVWSRGPDIQENTGLAYRAGVNTDNIYSWTD